MSVARTHVSGPPQLVPTHVFDGAQVVVDLETSRYTLAGSPFGEPAGHVGRSCG